MTNFAEKLQTKTNEFKTNLETAATATKEQIAQRVQTSKEKAEQSKVAIQNQIATDKAEFQHKLDNIKVKIQAKKTEIHGKIDDTKAGFKAQKAQWDAENAEEYAREILTLAFFYIDEAESAIIEALSARLTADNLKENT